MIEATMASRVLKWVARVWSLASCVFVLAFVLGAGETTRAPSANEWVALAFWPIGVFIGLAIAWRREGVGGFLATACLAAFYLWNLIVRGRFPQGPWFALVAAPGLVFLFSWLARRRPPRMQTRGFRSTTRSPDPSLRS